MKSFLQICLVLAFAALLPLTACRQTSSDDEPLDTSTYRPLATPLTEFEQKLKDVRAGRFKFVWVFRRLDGQPFTSEDSQVLRTNATKVVDWIGLDDKKTYIAGSNFPLEPKNLAVLQKRFTIQDMSEARP